MATTVNVSLPRALAATLKTSYKYPICQKSVCSAKYYYVLGGVRYKSTPATASLMTEDENALQSKTDSKKDKLDLTFYDHEAAFKSKTTKEILRAMFVFQMCSIKPLVQNNQAVRNHLITVHVQNDIELFKLQFRI